MITYITSNDVMEGIPGDTPWEVGGRKIWMVILRPSSVIISIILLKRNIHIPTLKNQNSIFIKFC